MPIPSFVIPELRTERYSKSIAAPLIDGVFLKPAKHPLVSCFAEPIEHVRVCKPLRLILSSQLTDADIGM